MSPVDGLAMDWAERAILVSAILRRLAENLALPLLLILVLWLCLWATLWFLTRLPLTPRSRGPVVGAQKCLRHRRLQPLR